MTKKEEKCTCENCEPLALSIEGIRREERIKVLNEIGKRIMEQTGIYKQRPFNSDTDSIPLLGVDELLDILNEIRNVSYDDPNNH